LLIALRYSPKRLWPYRQFNLFALHTWTAYVALVLTIAHPITLLFSRSVIDHQKTQFSKHLPV